MRGNLGKNVTALTRYFLSAELRREKQYETGPDTQLAITESMDGQKTSSCRRKDAVRKKKLNNSKIYWLLSMRWWKPLTHMPIAHTDILTMH